MKLVGWIYLFAYLVDCLMSMAAALVPSLSSVSNAISTPLMLSAVIVLVFGATGLLLPRRVFIPLSGYYLGMTAFGLALSLVIAIENGGSGLAAGGGNPLQLLAERYAWYMPTLWALLVVQLALAAYGLVLYFRAQVPRPGEAPATS